MTLIHRVVASIGIVAAVSVVAGGERLYTSGALELDPFSGFAIALVFAGLLFSAGVPQRYGEFVVLAVVASTRNLVVIAAGVAMVAALVVGRRAWVAVLLLAPLPFFPGPDLARLEATPVVSIGIFLFGLLLTWFTLYRFVFARDHYAPPDSVPLAFAALVAVTTVSLRLDAWLPDTPSIEGVLAASGVLFLVLGALGVFFAADRRNLVRWGLLAHAGLLCLFLLGGVRARPYVLGQLVVAGACVHLLAFARERLSLVLGSLALFSPPPLPGFALALGVSSPVIAEGYAWLMAAVFPAVVLLGVGALRYLWKRHERPIFEAPLRPLGVVIALAVIVLLGVWPGPLLSLARLAASGLF